MEIIYLKFEIEIVTKLDEQVYILGNQASLGMWNKGTCISLYCKKYPKWETKYLPIILNGEEVLEFKFLIKNREDNIIKWENVHGNRVLGLNIFCAGMKYLVNSGTLGIKTEPFVSSKGFVYTSFPQLFEQYISTIENKRECSKSFLGEIKSLYEHYLSGMKDRSLQELCGELLGQTTINSSPSKKENKNEELAEMENDNIFSTLELLNEITECINSRLSEEYSTKLFNLSIEIENYMLHLILKSVWKHLTEVDKDLNVIPINKINQLSKYADILLSTLQYLKKSQIIASKFVAELEKVRDLLVKQLSEISTDVTFLYSKKIQFLDYLFNFYRAFLDTVSLFSNFRGATTNIVYTSIHTKLVSLGNLAIDCYDLFVVTNMERMIMNYIQQKLMIVDEYGEAEAFETKIIQNNQFIVLPLGVKELGMMHCDLCHSKEQIMDDINCFVSQISNVYTTNQKKSVQAKPTNIKHI